MSILIPAGGDSAGDTNAIPQALGLVAWTVDPMLATFDATQANVHLVAVWLKAGTVITYLSVPVSAAGVTLTHGQLGIYSGDYQTLLASTADNPTAFQTTGYVELPLSPGPWTCPADGLYYLASTYAGTTLPTVANFKQSEVAANLPGGTFRGIHGQVAAPLPAPIVSQGTFTNVPCIMAR